MGYALPTTTDYVSCSHRCHAQRNPPSSEPGTDYGSAYGSPLYAPGNGKVSDRKDTNSGATGRYLTIDMDDGRRTRSLHLSAINVAVGTRVSRGQLVGKTGASGFGSDWGYGAHVHQSLWKSHAYSFCSTCTLDFALFVGSTPTAGNQRTVASNGANGRSKPTTTVPVTQTLPPGTVADFNGWSYGESVDGNKTWFHGQHSGDWFWSGGFTDKTTHDLENLNPTVLGPKQRKTGENGANGRALPNTTATIQLSLAPGAVGDFAGWINGERVENNPVWFKVSGGPYFWSGGFEGGANTSNLTDLNPAQPLSKERLVGANSANGRSAPTTAAPVKQSLSAGTVAEMDGYTKGEVVSQNDVWFRGAHSGDWFWSGGFVNGANIEGLPLVAAPAPPNQNNPRGLVEYDPIMPADIGLVAPLGDGLRGQKGIPPVSVPIVIDRAIIHHTGTTIDQLDYFSWKNERSSCPNKYVRPDGWSAEMIRPRNKPASTGSEWNWRSFAWEILDSAPAPLWTIDDRAKMTVALDIVFLAEHDGEELDGIPVKFKIDATHIIGHNQALPGTECPGPDMDVAGIITLAKQLWAEKYPPVEPPVEPPIEPPVEPPVEPGDTVTVPRDFLEALNLQLDAASETIDGMLAE